MKSHAKPGAMLKGLRRDKGWKLVDLAARTGFPISTLSKMENGKIALTYEKLARVSQALDIDIGVFFAHTPEPAAPELAPSAATGRRSIMRAGDGQEIETETYNYLYQATDLLNKRFVPMIASPHVRSVETFGDWVRHAGEEYTYVLEGAVDLHSELYAPVRLEAGDSIYFDSAMGHAYIAVGDGPCRVLTICTGDESRSLPVPDASAPPAESRSATVSPRPSVRKAGASAKARAGHSPTPAAARRRAGD